ncbi:MAG: serine/threonine kinase PknH, partial [Solirubrobacteraceae bacterium]|nr:serine/threonine kinase PknH [Solirubrobacteraceae bacterium]
MTLGEGARVGPYRLERLLGRGGMAVVYEATHESIGRTVALKLISPDLTAPDVLDRFRQEARMQAALDHPHAVTIYEAGTFEGSPYIAMRLVQGTTLAGLIDAGSLTSARTLRLIEQIAGALDAAHAAGLVHRDVKPRNVLVDDDDNAFLADFGLTRSGDTEGATASGQFMGTIAYVAPEVVSGEASTPAADRYALAAVLFECLTGTTVFPRPTQAAVLFAHTHEPPPRVSGRREGIPAALDEVLIAGLAKAPAARPARAADLVARARAALTGIELGPPAPRVPSAPEDETTAGQVTVPTPVAPAPPAHRGRRGLAVAA